MCADFVLTADVAVVGGGPAGMTAAVLLARHGVRAVVAERDLNREFVAGEHLPPSGVRLLADLGLSQVAEDAHHLPCTGVDSAWGGSTTTATDYLFNPYGDGLNLSRPAFDRSLADAAERAGATVLPNCSVVDVKDAEEHWQLSVTSQPKVHGSIAARFLVDASGRLSRIRRHAGGASKRFDRLVGVCGIVTASESEDHAPLRVTIESNEEGWWYSVPLKGRARVATYMTDADILAAYGASKETFWSHQIESAPHIASLLETCSAPNSVHVRPAHSQLSTMIGGKRFLAIGDAAMSFDPLASDGINKALRGAVAAVPTIVASLNGEPLSAALRVHELESEFDAYRTKLGAYYRQEQRWPEATFWRRRQS